MQQRYRLPDGRIAEALPGGGYAVVPNAAPDQSQPIVTRRADPREPVQLERERVALERDRNAAAASATDPEQNRIALERERVALRLQELELEKGRQGPQPAAPTAADTTANTGRIAALNAITNQLRAVRSRYENQLEGQGLSSIMQMLPTPGNMAFSTAADGITNPFMAAFKVAGQGTQSDADQLQFIQANIPRHNDYDSVIEQKLANIENRVGEFRQAANLPETPAVQPPSAAEQGADQSQQIVASGGNGGARPTLSRGTRSMEDATLRGVGARVGQMLSRGDSDDKVLGYLRQSGIDPSGTSIGTALQFRRTRQFQTWKQQNPGRPYPVGPNFYTTEVPLGPVENVINNVAQGPVGAYGIAAANGLTLNRMDDIAESMGGNGEQVRVAQDLVRAQNPGVSLLGDISGQMLLEGTVGKIPGARSLMSSQWGRRAADVGFGAAYGSGMGEGTSLEGGVMGGGLGLAGGAVGRRVQSGVGGAFTGIKNESLDYLRQRGVTPTLGQIARAVNERSLPARAIAGTEDRLAGLPGVGDFVNIARTRTANQFENAGFNEGLAPIGGANAGRQGVDAVDNMQTLTGQAYRDTLDGRTIPADDQFVSEIAAARAAAGLADPRALRTIDNAFERRMDTGALSGEDFQGARQVLRSEAPKFELEPGGFAAARPVREAEQSLTGLAQRQAPEVMPRLTAADMAYRNQQILQSAGPANGARPMTPNELARAARANTVRYGGRNQAASSDRPFTDLTTAGQRVLPSAVPDSGTAGRNALLLPVAGGALGGTGGGVFGEEGQRGGSALSGAGTRARLSARRSRHRIAA
ncbi:MAG: hypothetical protein M3448_08510 [Pseudomonadota bacterium]|nr:hypothetical protein [Pseudomonadota bacterium]